MADLKEFTPYFLGLLATAVAWLFKSVIEQGKQIVAVQTACKYYFEAKAKGAAMVLDSPNPTPMEMRLLLRKYYNGEASKSDVEELKAWLRGLIDDPGTPKSERSSAIDFLSGIGAMKILDRGKHNHGH